MGEQKHRNSLTPTAAVARRVVTTQVWIRDQDEAVAFWMQRMGFEVKEDLTVAELGNFGWVAVGPTLPGCHAARGGDLAPGCGLRSQLAHGPATHFSWAAGL